MGNFFTRVFHRLFEQHEQVHVYLDDVLVVFPEPIGSAEQEQNDRTLGIVARFMQLFRFFDS